MRRRGLKLHPVELPLAGLGVASHAEAWIETPCAMNYRKANGVASHAEAWIETRS